MTRSITMLLLLCTLAMAASVTQRIMEDGSLSVDQRALYLVYSVMAPERLPAVYTENAQFDRSGSPALIEAMLSENQLSQATLEEILRLANRPNLSGSPESFISPSDHFRIHYTLTGLDATTLDYAQAIAEYMDYSWAVLCDDMGFITPPPDNGVGGCNRYDVYILKLSGGTIGYCSSGGEYQPPDSSQNCSASHIAITTGLGPGTASVTCTHEFHHAIQASYDYTEPTWFRENSSMWSEDQVYPDVNDWLGFWGEGGARKPWMDITSGNPYWYGGGIYPRMMSNMFGYEAVREVWENCADVLGPNMLSAIDQMFVNHGMNFEQGFMAYSLWRYFTGPLWNPLFNLFDEDLSLPSSGPAVLPYHNFNSLPASGDEGVYPPETRGINWIRVNLADYQGGWVQFDFDGRDGFDWKVGAIIYNDDSFQFDWYDCHPSSGEKSVAVPTAGWDFAVFFPAQLTQTTLSGNFTFDISYTTGIEEGESLTGTSLFVESNPAAAGGAVMFSVPVTGHADLSVVDMAGRRVGTLFSGIALEGSHSAVIGHDLAPGTYFLVLRQGNAMEAVRVSLVR